MWLLLLICGVVASARADCHACIAGICYSQNTLIQRYRVTDQLAIDRTNNILYAQLNYNLNTALNLNELNISLTRLIQKKKTSGMVVDQNTQDLYTSQFGVIHRYKYKQNYSIDSFTIGPYIAHKLLYDDTLYMITPGGRFVYLNKTTKAEDDNHLKDYEVAAMIKVNATALFIVNDDVYKLDWDDGSTQLICKDKQVLSKDKYGDVYFVDSFQRIIYKRDNMTGELEEYANFKSGSIKDFIFDKDNNIIFRDMDDVVKQWVPENEVCINSSPQDVCHIQED